MDKITFKKISNVKSPEISNSKIDLFVPEKSGNFSISKGEGTLLKSGLVFDYNPEEYILILVGNKSLADKGIYVCPTTVEPNEECIIQIHKIGISVFWIEPDNKIATIIVTKNPKISIEEKIE